MKAIILAAGRGRRMAPLSDQTHKTLLPIAGTTIFHRLLDSLRLNGVRDVVLVTGYLHDDLVAVVERDFPDLSVEFVRNHEFEVTNNVYSLALALEATTVDDDLLLIESDLIVEPEVLTQIINSPYPNAALVDRYRPGLDGTVVSVDENNAICEVHPPHLQDERFYFDNKYKTLNIYRFDREFANTKLRSMLSFYSRVIDNGCYYELVLGVLIYMRATTMYAEYVQHHWAEVDDPNDLLCAEYQFSPLERLSIADRTKGGAWNLPRQDFAYMRNPYFPTPAVLAQLRGHVGLLSTSYSSSQAVLNAKLSYFVGQPKEHLFLLNGASQAYPILGQLFADRQVLVPSPTFGEYARVFPSATFYEDMGEGAGRSLAEHAQHADVVVVVNPNNPTGTTVHTTELVDLANERPERLLVVDESFIDFSGQPSIMGAAQRRQLDNVVVLKSLSKSLGVPGLRLGYVYSRRAEVLDALWGQVPIWNVNSVAEYFLELVLKNRDSLDRSFHQVRADRELLVAELDALELVDRVFPSGGNFVLVRLRGDRAFADAIVRWLMVEHFVYVKDASERFGDGAGYLRIAMRTRAENEELSKLLIEASSSLGQAAA